MDNYNNQNYGNQGYGNPNYQQQNYQQQNVQMNKGYSNPTQPIRGWSWGAFMFNVAWGIGNKCYLPLLCFVPVLNIIWIFICGAKGHEWAMNSGTFRTVEEYNATMSTWDRAGKIMFFVSLAIAVIWVLIFSVLMGSVFSALSSLH